MMPGAMCPRPSEGGVKRGLTLERHRELGARLSAGRAALALMRAELDASYRRDHTVLAMAADALRALDRLRAELENAGCVEHGRGFEGSIYFPTAKGAS